MRRVKKIAVLAALAGVLSWAGSPAAAEPVVQTDAGSVRGEIDEGIAAFRGIPYAAPPIGEMRWRAPQPVKAWSGERKAIEFGAACPQAERPDRGRIDVDRGASELSEDCLTLNVWTPATDAKTPAKLPVMVWIHGGAHRFGASSAPFLDGSALAQQGAVVVTLNYRIGLLGYFAHPALTAEAAADAPLGNYGLMDQLAALAFVQRNIARFGGDPSNVTVFGESAGGASILFLLATPAAKGLFARAIVQSGGGWQRPGDLAEKEREGIEAAVAAGLPGTASLAQLRALPVDALTAAIGKVPPLGFGPFADGRLVKEVPAAAFRGGRALDVPLIIGSNSDEASLMDMLDVPPAAMLARLPAGDAADSPRKLYATEAPNDEALARAYFADVSFTAPARWIAAQASSGAPSWLYRFSYTLQARGQTPGARHGADILYIFRTLSAIPMARLLVRDRDRAMSETISNCWLAFAKTGTPSCTGGAQWPAYVPTEDRLLEFGVETAVRTQFRKTILDAHDVRFNAALDAAVKDSGSSARLAPRAGAP